MEKSHVSVSPAALLLGALLYCTADFSELAAILAPVIVHELGHIVTLRLYGLRIRRVRADLRGLCIEYGGLCSPWGHAVSAFAGPAAGLGYAFAASHIGNRLGSDWLCLTAGVSLLLSLFNLLPALPLDGGTILLHLSCAVLGDRRGAVLTEAAGLIVGAGLLGGGFYLMMHGKGVALALAAIWLLLAQEDGRGLVKRREMI